MDIKNQAPAYYRKQILIDASPASVYDVISNLDEWASWQSGVRMIKSLQHPEEGQSFKWNNGGMLINSTISKLIPGSLFCWKSRAMWIKARISWEFENEGDSCLVTYEQSIEGFGSGLMKSALSNSMETTLLELKKYCEIELVHA